MGGMVACYVGFNFVFAEVADHSVLNTDREILLTLILGANTLARYFDVWIATVNHGEC